MKIKDVELAATLKRREDELRKMLESVQHSGVYNARAYPRDSEDKLSLSINGFSAEIDNRIEAIRVLTDLRAKNIEALKAIGVEV